MQKVVGSSWCVSRSESYVTVTAGVDRIAPPVFVAQSWLPLATSRQYSRPEMSPM